jgi:DegV family protein with EDD domain
MPIRIVTDSACDLPKELIQQYQINVVPLYINIGNKSYLDGVEMGHEAFYSGLENFEHHPQTAAPGPDTFEKYYNSISNENDDEILSIHVSGSLSATITSAQKAARQSKARVTVYDSGQLGLGAGLQVLLAAKAAAAGNSMQEVLSQIKNLGRRTHVFAVLDTLKYLQRSGRMNMAMAGVGSLLRIKPLMKMHEGIPSSEKISTHFRAMQRLIDLTEKVGELEELHYLHTQALSAAKSFYERTKELVPSNTTPIFQSITPVLGAHVGPNVLGVVCVTKK